MKYEGLRYVPSRPRITSLEEQSMNTITQTIRLEIPTTMPVARIVGAIAKAVGDELNGTVSYQNGQFTVRVKERPPRDEDLWHAAKVAAGDSSGFSARDPALKGGEDVKVSRKNWRLK